MFDYEIEIGSCIGDMHDGIPKEIDVKRHTKVKNENAYEVALLLLKGAGVSDYFVPINKFAYIIGESHVGNDNCLQAVYSYDGRTLGIIDFMPPETY